MKKRVLLLISALALSGFLCTACHTDDPEIPDNPEERIDSEDLEPLKRSVPVTENWVFDKRPNITVHIENPNPVVVEAKVKARITTDTHQAVTTIEKTLEVAANGETDVPITSDEDFAPGFYQAECFVNGKGAGNFHFGISPFQIVSAPDKQDDFDAFWKTALDQLPTLNETTVTLQEIKSSDQCKVYFMEMQSVPDGLKGDPVIVRGYYLEPQDGKKHPALLHFQGYDTLNNPPKMSCPSPNDGAFAEFYLSHRGQYINHRSADKRSDGIEKSFENIYGDWFAFNFGDKDGYYYRGAFMDCVQAVRFVASRPSIDVNNIFAEGSSQGGALCYAAAALSDIPLAAIAPNVAFLGDFPDYFKIVSWPGNVAKANQGSMTDEQMYAFLSYFDTKNLATRISCPVYATIGLQDRTCPPHTNIAPYNNLLSEDKQMSFYARMEHSYPSNWTSDIMAFFKARMK